MQYSKHPKNVLNERTLKGTFFTNYKPHSDFTSIVDKYMKKVNATWRSSSHIQGRPSLHHSNGREKLEEANKNKLLVCG
ncbi:hypothetical protein AMTRI_Chr02g218140 [Amborella trichopoda]